MEEKYPSPTQKNIKALPDTPMLQTVGVDLTALARAGKLDRLYGREHEIKYLGLTLARRKKANPVLIGEPGVGKTAIVEGLAIKIANGEVEDFLKDKKIYFIDLANVVVEGDPIKIFKIIINELEKRPDIIIFIDELHGTVGLGANGALDVANVLKPALARGSIRVIGSTTIKEYKQHIEKDGALTRRFLTIFVEEPNEEKTIEILKQTQELYEKHHNVSYTDDEIKLCVRASGQYMSGKCFPDKAFDLLDFAGSLAKQENPLSETNPELHIQIENIIENNNKIRAKIAEYAIKINEHELNAEYEMMAELKIQLDEYREKNAIIDVDEIEIPRVKVTCEHIQKIVSNITGIPIDTLNTDETEKLKTLETYLKTKIIGQDEAVRTLSRAIKRARIGMRDNTKPIGSYIFSGTTGVGKTELAKQISIFMYGDEKSMIRLDMSEYQEKHTISKIIGSPPGYVGYEEGGQLTEKIRRRPYSIILLDEIEKAHPHIFDTFLQILDDGVLTDSHGVKVDFRNTLILMTTNCGTDDIKKYNAQGDSPRMQALMFEALKKHFRPEFLNRIDGIIQFNELTRPNMLKIVELGLQKVVLRAAHKGFELSFNNAVKEFLIDKGFDSEYGARPLMRAIQSYVEDEITNYLIDNPNVSKLNFDIIETNTDYQAIIT